MTYAAAQNIFDPRFKQATYSGSEQDESEKAVLNDFINSFSSLSTRFSDQVNGTTLSKEIDANSSLVALEYDIDINELIARLAPRKPEYAVGGKVHSFSPMAEWEGYVNSIADGKFFVSLVNLKDPSGSTEEEAEFSLNDLTAFEQEEIEVGSVVRWVVGFEKLANDMRQRVSRVHIRRLPSYSESEIGNAIRDAEKFNEEVNWDESS